MPNYPTPHINAAPDDFAKTVLLPGDPKRSMYIAQNYLSNAVLINDVRGVQGYTGEFNGVPITVMASGMGMPSMAIYSHELFGIFGVQNIIRIGTVGGYADSVHLNDIILALSASTNSNMQNIYGLNGHFAPTASYNLLKTAAKTADELGVKYLAGNVLTSDSFYQPSLDSAKKWRSLNTLGVDMETAALYMQAAECGKNALSILTVSNHIFTGEEMSAEQRERSLDNMITLALNTATRI